MLESVLLIAGAAVVGIVAGQLLIRRRLVAIGLVGLFAVVLVAYWVAGADSTSTAEPVTPPGPSYFA